MIQPGIPSGRDTLDQAQARMTFVAPGLGDRNAARHLGLTYPIKFVCLRPDGRRRSHAREGGAALWSWPQIGCPGADQNLATIDHPVPRDQALTDRLSDPRKKWHSVDAGWVATRWGQ